MPETTKVVEVIPYNEQWELEFENIKRFMVDILGDLLICVEHVGSTSVKGLFAKPIIDIDVVIENYSVFPEVVRKLEHEGYIHEGNLGVDGREAFKRRYSDHFMKYHLYVCPRDGKGYLEHIALRDYLRLHPEAVEEYSKLKLDLADKYQYDIDSYCNRKTDFISEILKKTIYRSS